MLPLIDDDEEHDEEEIGTESTEGSDELSEEDDYDGEYREGYQEFIVIAAHGIIFTYNFELENWEPIYEFPRGTALNVLFFDDLVVGTGIGLYDQPLQEGFEVREVLRHFDEDRVDRIEDGWVHHRALGLLQGESFPWVYNPGLGWMYADEGDEEEETPGDEADESEESFFYLGGLGGWIHYDEENFSMYTIS